MGEAHDDAKFKKIIQALSSTNNIEKVCKSWSLDFVNETIEFLANKHDEGTPLVDDFVFDSLLQYFNDISKTKTSSDISCKIYDCQFNRKTYEKFANLGKVIITAKLDGFSGRIVMINKQIKMFTKMRNGEQNDISDKLVNLSCIDALRKLAAQINCELIGELIVSKANTPQNIPTRSVIASVLKRNKADPNQKIDFVIFDAINVSASLSKLYQHKLEFFKNQGLTVVPLTSDVNSSFFVNEKFWKKVKKTYQDINYDCDGVVVRPTISVSDVYFAHKFSSDQFPVIVKAIEWSLKNKIYYPTIQFDPITVNNRVFGQVSMSNAKKLFNAQACVQSTIIVTILGNSSIVYVSTVNPTPTPITETLLWNLPVDSHFDGINLVDLKQEEGITLESFRRLLEVLKLENIGTVKSHMFFCYLKKNKIPDDLKEFIDCCLSLNIDENDKNYKPIDSIVRKIRVAMKTKKFTIDELLYIAPTEKNSLSKTKIQEYLNQNKTIVALMQHDIKSPKVIKAVVEIPQFKEQRVVDFKERISVIKNWSLDQIPITYDVYRY